MHFISEIRYNPRTQCDERYYRIKESFRNQTGRSRSRVLLQVGFITPDPSPEDIRDVGRCLNWMRGHQGATDGQSLSHGGAGMNNGSACRPQNLKKI